MVTFVIPGSPKGKLRPRFTQTGHVYTPQATRDYELYAVKLAMAAGAELLGRGTSVGIRIDCHFAIPASWTKARRKAAANGGLHPMQKPDIDNIGKVILDSLNGICYCDDRQVNCLVVNRDFAEEPSVEVTVWNMLQEAAPV